MWEWESVEFVWEECVGAAWACGCVVCLLCFGRVGESGKGRLGMGSWETTTLAIALRLRIMVKVLPGTAEMGTAAGACMGGECGRGR